MLRIHLQGRISSKQPTMASTQTVPGRTLKRLLMGAMLASSTVYAAEMPATVEDVHRLFAQYLTEGNKEGLGSLFEPKAIFIAADGSRVEGRDNVVKALSAYMGATLPIKTLARSIYINGDLAMTRSHWKLGEQEGVALETLRYDKQAGWRYVIDNPHGK
ncbi:YybH family protein [Chitinimonas sp. PSY-7]|uniref:DUF4440 domain-containing protein n=1 Tax=Chitinimonas sp. PSY-7 TaxID=3459088 RepID=UPI0040401994